ncbi:MAG: hypothetical protein J6W45_01450 [Bacteroidales bacterium]|nr:hypothetical protein [Bacteroidales bacterium]
MRLPKTYLVLLLFALCGKAFAQTDSAAVVIDRYLALLNHDDLNWKTVRIKSTVTNNINSDTIYMERRFAFPGYSFVEITRNGNVMDGYFANGDECITYDEKTKEWVVMAKDRYDKMMEGYDVRGPLFNWHNRDVKAKYLGVSTFEGNQGYVVSVIDPERNPRNYLFETTTGYLFLIVEQKPENDDKKQVQKVQIPTVDWRAIHEYTPVGGYLFPTLESYQVGNTIIIVSSQVEIVPFSEKDFQKP